MRKNHFFQRLFGWVAVYGAGMCLFLACGPAKNDPGAEGNPSQDGGGKETQQQKGLCGNGCPKGQFCLNGLCVIGCNTNAECAADQYCDTYFNRCANKKIETCPDVPCSKGQECVNGYCSASKAPPAKKKEEPGACKIAVDGADGCAKNELCVLKEENMTQCRSFPPCPEDGKCPVGVTGAVCNEKLIAEKGRICLVGMCQSKSDCPSGWQCVQPGGSVLGICSSGALGMPCATPAHCKQGLSCTQPAPSMMGFCLGGMPPLP